MEAMEAIGLTAMLVLSACVAALVVALLHAAAIHAAAIHAAAGAVPVHGIGRMRTHGAHARGVAGTGRPRQVRSGRRPTSSRS